MVELQELVTKVQEFIELHCQDQLHEVLAAGRRSITVDFAQLAKFDHELAEHVLAEPEECIKTFDIALQNVDIPPEVFVRARFIKLPKTQETKIRDLRSEHLNKFMMLSGIVKQSSDVRPQVVTAKFECPSCGNNITMPQLESRFKEPYRCSCGRKGKFRMISKVLVDSQRIVLEESPEALQGGEQPKRVSVFLREDLVEPKMEKRTTPGAKVLVYGVVKEVPVQSKAGVQLTRYDICVEANNVEPIEETYEDIMISKEDEKRIKELARDPKVYEKLVNSIAPSIYGHEDIKGALVLQLMGGMRKERPDGTVVKGDIHILLVGDPGAAKSTLLMYMSKAAPKARYVAGRGASAAGISATVVKDEFLRGWALEAGAIVLANGGFLLLDEMDKMSMEDTSALHEALSQQTVTIAKANIQATLSARTTLLAAANPKFGRFDPYQPIAAQIDLPPALINRFDLIFPVRDLPSKERDTRIATHILEAQDHAERLKPEVPMDLMKKFVAYVRQGVFPRLSEDAIEEIRDFYVTLRNAAVPGDAGVKPIPISARQLEALVRLAEGSARVRLSKEVTRKDARNAISILKQCLMQVGFDAETGQIDIDRISTGIPASTRSKIIIVREIIHELDAKGKKNIPIDEVIELAQGRSLTQAQVEEVIEKLKKEGEIFEPRRGWVAKI